MANDLSNQQSSSADATHDVDRTQLLNSFSPEKIGRAAAVGHGPPDWQRTVDYAAERLIMLQEAFRHLHKVLELDADNGSALLLHQQLEEANATLHKGLPAELPFLWSRSPMRLRLRVAAVTREWLLITDSNPRLEDFESFLRAYQKISPLYFTEICLIPTALRLAAAEKCHILPCPGNSGHVDLIPRLLEDLAKTCRLIIDTDWNIFGEQVGHAHSLPVRAGNLIRVDSPVPSNENGFHQSKFENFE